MTGYRKKFMATAIIDPTLSINKNCCPKGMQFFLAQVEQGKETVCACLRGSAVKKLNH
jgi:hypothetical protein